MIWNKVFVIVLLALTSCSHSKGKYKSQQNDDSTSTVVFENSKYENFKLNYLCAGLGPGMGSMQPVLRVSGIRYIYTFEQNSTWDGRITEKPDTICTGILRITSIDSILEIVRNVKDTLIKKYNLNIIDGNMHYITVSLDTMKLSFELNNAYDASAQKIIDIINSNLPKGKSKLWLAGDPRNPPKSVEINIGPFDTINYDKVVAYDYYGDGGKSIVSDGLLCDKKDIVKVRELTEVQVNKLHKIISDRKNFGGGTAGCFDPHLGFVYYKQDKIVGHISVCLDCNFLSSSITIPASLENNSTTGFSDKGRKQFSNICKELQFSHWKLNSPLFD